MTNELHVLNDNALERRAAGEDSFRALQGTAGRLYAQLTLAAHNDQIPPPWSPASFRRYLKWAWLVEGGAQYFAGHVALFRGAVGRRLAESSAPSFPPSARDAIVLGGTIFDLLDREIGRHACELLISRIRKDGATPALELAFGVDIDAIESAWRLHLRQLVERHAAG
jgi:hypothetical protein